MTLSTKPMKFLLSATVLAVLAACGGGGDEVAAGDTTSQGTGAATPDLIFSPAQITVAPGQEASIQVRVDSNADLRGASFDLPGVQDGVTATFQAAEDGKTGVLKIAASTASAGGDVAVNVKGTSGIDASKVWVGALRVKTTTVIAAKELFVNPTAVGSDSGDGSATKPFKTIGKAVSMALPGAIVTLASGSYTPLVNGERYPINVPAGVTIRGTLLSNGAQGSRLSPQTSAEHATGLVFLGDATVKDVELDVFGTALSATKGTQVLNNLSLVLNHKSVSLADQAKATLKNSQILMDQGLVADVGGHAALTVDGGVAQTFGPNCNRDADGIFARGNGTIALKNGLKLVNLPGINLALSENSSASLSAVTIQRSHPAGCFPGATIRADDTASLQLLATNVIAAGGDSSVGISIRGSAGATLTNSTISGHTGTGSGVIMGGTLLTVKGGAIKGNGTGISADVNGVPKLHLEATKIESNGVGIDVNTPELFVLDSSLSNNGFAVQIKGSFGIGGGLIGLGGVTSGGIPLAGRNTIRGNSVGVRFLGTGPIDLSGNTWNANAQGADSQGRYPAGFTVRSGESNSDGSNFQLVGPNEIAKF